MAISTQNAATVTKVSCFVGYIGWLENAHP
jgi:hypothetical protein